MINVTKTDLPDLEKLMPYLEKIWASNWVTNDGEQLKSLERRLEEYLGVDRLAVVSNGTLALHLVIKSLALEGSVVTTPFTFATTTNALVWEGLRPVFADIDPRTFCIDPSDVRRKMTPDVSAILAVHVYGNPCDVHGLAAISQEYGVPLIYDAAHCFGVEFEGHTVLDFGDASTLSFHATKVYNTMEGGAVASPDEAILQAVMDMRNHGIVSEERVVLPGTNAKMSELHAAVGLCNLEEIDKKIAARRRIYEAYLDSLSAVEGLSFQELVASRYNYAYMPVMFSGPAARDSVCAALLSNGYGREVFCAAHDRVRIHQQRARREGHAIPNALDVAGRILCLPLYPDLDLEDFNTIVDVVKNGEGQ